MGTTTTEAKLAQQLAFIKQGLYGVFIDPRKAYKKMEKQRYLEILENYGGGHNILRLIRYF